jgi:hypothetical protein
MDNEKTWHHVREYINTVKDGYVTRKNLLTHLNSIESIRFSECYVDTLRNQLEKAGYLGKMKTTSGAPIAGKYYRIKQIPLTLSVGLLRNEYHVALNNLVPKQIDI